MSQWHCEDHGVPRGPSDLLDKTAGFWKNKSVLWPLCAFGLNERR
jgi:hypothetical protein